MKTIFKNIHLHFKYMPFFNQSNILSVIIAKIFTRSNFNKAIIIFIFGLISRISISYFYNINVFTEFFHYISLSYYFLFSLFIVSTHEVVNYFNVNIIPHFITDFFAIASQNIVNLYNQNIKILKWIFNTLKSPFYIINSLASHKWEDLNLSSIRKYIKFLFSQTVENKITMGTDNAIAASIKIAEPKAPVIPTTLNMHGDFNLYDSDRNSEDLSSRSETSAYLPTPSRPLPDNTPLTTTDNTPVKPITHDTVTENHYENHNASRVNNPPVNNRMLFVVDTIREHSDVGSTGLQTPNPDNNIPRPPLPSGFTTPSTMTPLFGSSRNPSIEYANTPGLTPYVSHDSNKAIIGLNYSNENIWRNRFISESDIQSTNWTHQRQLAEENMRERYLEERGFATGLTNSLPSTEIEVKKGLFGRLKLQFKLIDSKLEAKISNMDSIAIKLHDSSKRKFFWNIWEKKSGNYESYEDFKRSWDPKTNIWNEIKSRTNHDVRVDVEGILGVGRNRPQLNPTPIRVIEQRNVGVRNNTNHLIRDIQPSAPTPLEEAPNTVENPESQRRRHKSRSHSRSHSHSHTHRKNSHSRRYNKR